MEKVHVDFRDQITSNKRKSFFLIICVFVVLVAFGYIISLAFTQADFFFIMTITIIISVSYTLLSYYNSDKIAIASVGAREASRTEYRDLYNLIEGLTLASGLPMPKVYIMKSEQINAFASGRDPQHAVVCVTEGAVNKLERRELEGVLAHELGHVGNYDIRYMTLVAVMVGMIAIASEIFLRSLWFKNNDRDNKGGAILIVIGVVLAILAPIVVQLVQLSISRKREYSADATAVKFMRTPTGLIGALTKIKNNQEMKVAGSISPLFFAKPNRAAELFSTHPPLEKRIDILKKM